MGVGTRWDWVKSGNEVTKFVNREIGMLDDILSIRFNNKINLYNNRTCSHGSRLIWEEHDHNWVGLSCSIIVVGMHDLIISSTCQTIEDFPLKPKHGSLWKSSFVAAEVKYEYKCSRRTHTWNEDLRGALHMPIIKENLFPTFITKEVDQNISTTPNVSTSSRSVNMNCMTYK